jgi:excisionase family DNA binding protein
MDRPIAIASPQPTNASAAPDLHTVPERFLDAQEAAQFLGLHPRTVQRLAREGIIPAHPIGNGVRRRWRFLLSELDAWLRDRVHSPRHPCDDSRRKE